MDQQASMLDQPLRAFLDAVPARTPAPAGGSVAAVVAALAAGLAAMAARFAPEDWPERAAAVARAEALRAQAEPLADEDAAAYAAFLAGEDGAEARIVEIPLLLAGIAADTATLAARVALEGNPRVAGDAAAGAALAAAAARVAARLVGINAGPDDRRARAAAGLARTAEAAAREALQDGGSRDAAR